MLLPTCRRHILPLTRRWLLWFLRFLLLSLFWFFTKKPIEKTHKITSFNEILKQEALNFVLILYRYYITRADGFKLLEILVGGILFRDIGPILDFVRAYDITPQVLAK